MYEDKKTSKLHCQTGGTYLLSCGEDSTALSDYLQFRNTSVMSGLWYGSVRATSNVVNVTGVG